MIRRLLTWLRQRRCWHEFRGVEMQGRDGNGLLVWQCHKCGMVWRGQYGFHAPGKITGPWGRSDG